VLGLHLSQLGLTSGTAGLVVGLGLAGGAVAALAATLWADRSGRRRFLIALATLAAAGAAACAVASDPRTLGLCAFLGMVNGMGRDRSAALVLEQAILPSTGSEGDRTRSFAVFNPLQDAGHALGALLAGAPSALGVPVSATGLAAFGTAALLAAACVPLYARLSGASESGAPARLTVSPASRRFLTRLSALFAVDALGSGFLPTALLSYFFFERFGVSARVLALLFFMARVANAASHLLAAWLARRIGLVNTMVFTHIPSSLLLVTVAYAPSFPIAAALFVLREGLVEMDVPTRQSYLMAVVRPEERTVAAGVTSLVRLAAWAVAPPIAGVLMQHLSLGAPLAAGAAIKIAYDLALYASFRNVRPPEERAGG